MGNAATNATEQLITLKTQGSFAAGGTVVTDESGNTIHLDHAYVQYQVPLNARKFPLVMWHGGGQFSKTWESTPDGRDGYQNIFLRRGFTTYILDQPWRARGGQSKAGISLPAPVPYNPYNYTALIFNIFRLGTWLPPEPPKFFPNVQFPRDPASLEQYWRQTTVNVGPENADDFTRGVITDASAALFTKTGPAVLITHSASGKYGWLTRMKSPNVKAIVSYEPGGGFVFPSDEVPPTIASADPLTASLAEPILVPPADFAKLTEIPIQIVMGDNIETKTPSPITGVELWRVQLQQTIQFADAVNRRGGQVEILMLPDAGLHGNTHFPFSDLNNIQVADLLSDFLKKHKLDAR